MMQSESALPSRRRNRSTLNPWAKAVSIFNSIPRRSATISAVCEARAGVIFPDALAAEISVAIVTQLDARWQLLEQLRVAAAEHDVVDDKSALQLSKNALDIFLPDFPSNLFQTCFADAIFNCSLGK